MSRFCNYLVVIALSVVGCGARQQRGRRGDWPSLSTGHHDPEVPRYIGRIQTEAARKYFATVLEESMPSSSLTVEFRGLEGSETKADRWSATGSRQIGENDIELNHPLLENRSDGC